MKFIVEGVPPSMNRFAGRCNAQAYRAEKALWSDKMYCACLPRPRAPLSRALVRIDYFFADKRRRDPDNYSGKFLIDGLTRAGVIADDCFGCISLSVHGHCDPRRVRTEVVVQPIWEE